METETLEEAAINYAKQFDYAEDSSPQIDFIEGAKWQAERMYSEEDMKLAFEHGILFSKESVSLCKEAINTEYELFIQNIKNQTK
jgi:hypothetical protein